MPLSIHIHVTDEDASHWGPPAASAIPIHPAHLPEVGDLLLIDGTYWTCSARMWHKDGTGAAALDLWLVRNPEWTATVRRATLQVVLPEPTARPD